MTPVRNPRHSRPSARSVPAALRRLRLSIGAAASLLLAAGLVLAISGHHHARPAAIEVAGRSLPSLTHSATASHGLPPSASRSGTSTDSRSEVRAQPLRTHATSAPQPAPGTKAGTATGLPLRGFTGSADQIITVLAPSASSTTALVEAWSRQGETFARYGAGVIGNLGAAGLTTDPSEHKPATPIGSFTLTQAFGSDANPGTALPYLRTTPADWWISQPGSLYNTHQRCSSDCPFTQGAPNEHLLYETPAYDYAVVIDYNTLNSGPVRQGAGSAFFLHVSNGQPTAGCVSISQQRLITLLRWLKPTAHPRILIGIEGSG